MSDRGELLGGVHVGGNSPIQKVNVLEEDFGLDIPIESVPLPSRGLIYPIDSPLYAKETLDIRPMTAKEEGTNASFTKVKRVTVDFRDNIEEIEDLISLNIFPNPAFNTLNINMSLNDVETINVAVLDMHGRVVYTNEMNSNGINEKIDVSNFAAGLYQVRIIAGETTVSNSIQIGE